MVFLITEKKGFPSSNNPKPFAEKQENREVCVVVETVPLSRSNCLPLSTTAPLISYLASVNNRGASGAELNTRRRLGLHIQLQHPEVVALHSNQTIRFSLNRTILIFFCIYFSGKLECAGHSLLKDRYVAQLCFFTVSGFKTLKLIPGTAIYVQHE